MIRVVSPHADDAILSLGQMIAATDDDIEIITVFAGVPDADVLSDYDRARGYTTSSADAMRDRQHEDEAACAVLGARPVHLPFLDRQYQPERSGQERDAIVGLLADLWRGADVYGPLGIGHPDHVLVARCVWDACGRGRSMYVYEELPGRSLWPEQAADALAEMRASGLQTNQYVHPIAVGDRAIKERAIACYASQFDVDDDLHNPCFYVPERAWRTFRIT